MKSYNFGSKKNMVSKKEIEEQKRKEDEEAAARAFEEYMATFQTGLKSSATNKVWIKAGTYEAGKKHDEKDKGTLYKPTSRFESKPEPVMEEVKMERPGKKGKEKEKKKSNLEIFKEELKIIQEEREERHRLKTMLGLSEVIKLPPKPGTDYELRASLSLELDDKNMGSMTDEGDPNTTNIYLGNLPTKISEQQLMEIFGKFGPLASVKVMWPRTEEEKTRNRLSGFVAFCSRRDGERALKHLAGSKLLGSEIRLGWGKAVPIPSFPIYIPPAMLNMTMPPPLSGLPFNSQPDRRDRNRIPPIGTPYPVDGRGKEEFDKVLYNGTVKVVIPTDRSLLCLIHRMVEYVTREGPMFEAMIMNREINNPQYRFLFENQSPAHVYYRWKLYSILQGDQTHRWRTEDFRMFKGGSIWKPPNANLFTSGMPDELVPEEERDSRKGTLSNAQRDRMEKMLRSITPERHKISEVMIFSIEHAESAEEICQCLKESLSNPKTTLPRKVARLYIISDILYNCTLKGMDAIIYRKTFKSLLPSICQEVHYAYQTACDGGVGESAESFKQRVMACFKAWEEWGIYPNDFLIRLQNIFLGLLSANSRDEEEKILEGLENDDNDEEIIKKRRKSPPRAQQPPKSALNFVRSLQSAAPIEGNEEIDGVPLDLDGIPLPSNESEGILSVSDGIKKPAGGGFKPSKWETVDPEEVKAQAVTTMSKWDLFEETSNSNSNENNKDGEEMTRSDPQTGLVAYDEDIDGEPMEEEEEEAEEEIEEGEERGSSLNLAGFEDEERRAKLREIEVKVVAFQDEIESGRRSIKPGFNIAQMVGNYREKLLKRAEKDKSENSSLYEDEYRERDRQRSHRRRSRSGSYERGGSSRRERESHRDPREVDRNRERGRDRDRSRSPTTPRGGRQNSSRRRDSRSPNSRRYQRSRSKSPPSSRHSGRTRSRSRSGSPGSRDRHRRRHKR